MRSIRLGSEHISPPTWVKPQLAAVVKQAPDGPIGLARSSSTFGDVYEVASNPTKPASAEDIVQTQRYIRDLTKVCEREINEALLEQLSVAKCRAPSRP